MNAPLPNAQREAQGVYLQTYLAPFPKELMLRNQV